MKNETLTQRVLFEVNEEPDKPEKKLYSNYLIKDFIYPVITGLILGAVAITGVVSYSNHKRNLEIEKTRLAAERVRQDRQEYVLRVARHEQSPNKELFSLYEETGEPATLLHDLTFGPYINMFYQFIAPTDLTEKENKFIEQYRKDHPEYKP